MFVEATGNAFLDWVVGLITSSFDAFMQTFYTNDVQFFNNGIIQGLIIFFQMLAWGLFLVGSMMALFEFGLTYREGSGNFKNIGMGILKGFMAVMLFTTVPVELYKFSCDMQSYVANAIGAGSQQAGMDAGVGELISGGFKVLATNATSPLLVIIFIFLFIYCVFKVFFGNIKRGAILLLTICVGSLHMLGIPRGYQDSFMAWCRQVIGICFTVFLQNTLFLIGLLMALQNANSLVLCLGTLLVAAQATKFIQMFGVDCSAQGNIGGAVQTASTTFRTAKMLFMKG